MPARRHVALVASSLLLLLAYLASPPGLAWGLAIEPWLANSLLCELLITSGTLALVTGLYIRRSRMALGGWCFLSEKHQIASKGSVISIVCEAKRPRNLALNSFNTRFLGVGVACFVVLFFGSARTHIVALEELLVFTLGLLTLWLAAHKPGLAPFLVLGALLIIASLVMALAPLGAPSPSTQWALSGLGSSLARVAASLLGATVIVLIALAWRTPATLGRVLGFGLAPPLSSTPRRGAKSYADLANALGQSATPLRPSGKVYVDGRRYDAISERGYIAKGQAIQVVASQGFALSVRPVSGTSCEGRDT